MCGAVQELNTSPMRMETNYVRFTGMIYNMDKEKISIQALCPQCAPIVGDFIKQNRKNINPDGYKTENRVSTMR